VNATAPLLEVRGLHVHFPVRGGILRRVTGHVRAVDGVDLSVFQGETLGLVGESGCGKSTTSMMVMRLLDQTSGRISFDGDEIGAILPHAFDSG